MVSIFQKALVFLCINYLLSPVIVVGREYSASHTHGYGDAKQRVRADGTQPNIGNTDCIDGQR